ncbi:hypothetical protein BC938DRAFT_479966 [Jimgerdemannia flammicorona]|uniref:Uncharacterized protein n=1 Tax=Jimgerdemannia flammicorona TaxID=994334 RepID=A0A433QJP6_9FUNG|nr:hypothetical protein BC938DRAFT_479966 [Jimgerdemannia flammicorona]
MMALGRLADPRAGQVEKEEISHELGKQLLKFGEKLAEANKMLEEETDCYESTSRDGLNLVGRTVRRRCLLMMSPGSRLQQRR